MGFNSGFKGLNMHTEFCLAKMKKSPLEDLRVYGRIILRQMLIRQCKDMD